MWGMVVVGGGINHRHQEVVWKHGLGGGVLLF